MSDRSHDQDAAFAERVGHVLRAPERLSEDFDRALVAAIRNDQPITSAMRRRSSMLSRDWWSAPPTLSRAANLALAASLVALVAFGARTVAPVGSTTSRVVAATPVHAPGTDAGMT